MNADDDDVTLFARVERLERRAQRDRVVLLAVLALALVTAAAPSDSSSTPAALTVRAADGSQATLQGGGLVVTSASGAKRLGAGLSDGSDPGVSEYDTSGRLRQWYFLYQDGEPGLRQYDAANVMRTETFLADNGSPTMHLLNAQAVAQGAFFLGDKGLPEFDVRNTSGKAMGYISADDSGGYLVLKDPSLVTRSYIGQYTDGTWGIDVRNAQNQDLFSKP